MKTRKKKRALTLVEIMIVIVLIGLIGSVIGVNMLGSLEEGKAFKSRKAKVQIADILMLEVARGAQIGDVIKSPEIYLENSGLVKKPKAYMNDGWGQRFEILEDEARSGRILVRSEKLNQYEAEKSKKTGKLVPADEDNE